MIFYYWLWMMIKDYELGSCGQRIGKDIRGILEVRGNTFWNQEMDWSERSDNAVDFSLRYFVTVVQEAGRSHPPHLYFEQNYVPFLIQIISLSSSLFLPKSYK